MLCLCAHRGKCEDLADRWEVKIGSIQGNIWKACLSVHQERLHAWAEMAQSGQQCPSRESRILWGALMSLQAWRPLASGPDSPDAFSLLSTRKLHFALTVLPAGCVFTHRRSLPSAVWSCIGMRGLAKAGWLHGSGLGCRESAAECTLVGELLSCGSIRGWKQQCQLPNWAQASRENSGTPSQGSGTWSKRYHSLQRKDKQRSLLSSRCRKAVQSFVREVAQPVIQAVRYLWLPAVSPAPFLI